MAFVKFSPIFVILFLEWYFLQETTLVNGHPTYSTNPNHPAHRTHSMPSWEYSGSDSSDSDDDTDSDYIQSNDTGPYKRRVVKELDVELDSDDYTPQDINVDDLKDHPNYQEIKNMDKATLRAITMLARKKRRAKRNTLSTMLGYYKNNDNDIPLIVPEKATEVVVQKRTQTI